MESKFLRAITSPSYLCQGLLKKVSKFIKDDKLYLSLRHLATFGKKIDWDNPITFNEKMQWLKLFERKPEYTVMVDKVKVKEYVASVLGKEYIIPTLGVWDNPDKIDFDILPNRFVLKCNHNSGTGMYICKDKSKIDIEKVKDRLRKGLKEDYYLINREWPYKDVPRRILAEEYIDPAPNVKDLPDYKWYCFNGEPKYCQVIQNRTANETIDFFDTEWNHQDFIGLTPGAKHATELPKRPKSLEVQLHIAKELSKDMPFSRIDLYETCDKTYFGEITLFPLGGFGSFKPEHYNELLGRMIILPGENGRDDNQAKR